MSDELLSMNTSKVTSVINCRIPVELKGMFTLLAAEKGLNVNQLLALVVKEAVEKKHEKRLDAVSKERDNFHSQAKDLQGHLKKAQQEISEATTRIGNCEQANQKLSAQVKELNDNKLSLEEKIKGLQVDYVKALQHIKDGKNSFDNVKKQLESKEGAYLEILRKNTEVVARLKKAEHDDWRSLPKYAWSIINELHRVEASIVKEPSK